MKLNGESSNLSLEQVQKFNKTLSAIKDLPTQQEEIIKRVLKGETEIGELRLSFLEQHFDTYSKKLDEIVARKKSDLNDIFLILDNKLSNSYKKLSSDIDKLKEQLEGINTESNNKQQKPQKDSAETRDKNTKALVDTTLHMLANAYKQESEARAKIVGSGNSELLALEKQYQEQRYAQIKQHLGNITNITSDATNITAASLHEWKAAAINQNNEPKKDSAETSTTAGDIAKASVDAINKTSEVAEALPGLISDSTAKEVSAAIDNAIAEPSNAAAQLDGGIAGLPVEIKADNTIEQGLENIAKSASSAIEIAEESRKAGETLRAQIAAEAQQQKNEDISKYANSESHKPENIYDEIAATMSDGQAGITTNRPEGVEASGAEANNTDSAQEIDAVQNKLAGLLMPFMEFAEVLNKSGLNLEQLKNIDLNDWSDEQKDQLDKALKALSRAREQAYDDNIRTQERIDALREQMAERELARSEDAKDAQLRADRLRLNLLEDTIEAELKAQNLANQIDLQLSELSKEDYLELSSYGARGANAKADAEAEETLLKQMNDFRAELTAEVMAKNGGILLDGNAEDIDNKVRDQFRDYDNRLASIKAGKAAALAEDPRIVEANESRKAALIAKLELQAKKKNHGILDAIKKQQIKELADKEFELSGKNLDKLRKEQLKSDKERYKAELEAHKKKTESAVTGSLSKEDNLVERFNELKKATEEKINDGSGGSGIQKALAALDTTIVAISSLAAKLEKTIDDVASNQGNIDTRLQGSNNERSSGSYWRQLTKDMMEVGAVTPYFKQEDFAKNIKALVDQGISFDLKQRAFLMTIQEKIANTFSVADGTLLRLIRIQQEDSTAGRLGMESALNSFLNNMYENTEYLKTVAEGVRSSLQEMESLMAGAEATEVEYQVQKWMGSLYSVGMSQDAVNSIASALGQVAAGQVEALTNGSGAGNLLVMAANKSGKSISDILNEGLNAEETNKLLQAAVNHLAELAEYSKDSKVVQQQLANVYGVKASDLKAAVNLATKDSISTIYDGSKYSILNYDKMLGQLNEMAGTMHLRTSLGEMMQNVWANGQYTLAGSMANNPAAYLLYKTASLLDATTGGINLPFVSALGTGVDLETTVADLMRVGSMSAGILGSIGPMISGLANSFSGQAMLEQMGIGKGSGLTVNVRGTGDGVSASDATGGGAQTLSGSGYVGNASGSDIKNSTLQEAEDSKEKLMIEAIEEARANQIDYINENVLKIYELLDEVASGKRNLSVKVAGYGLTSASSSNSLVGAQGGVGGQLNVGNSTNSSSGTISGGFSSGNGGNSGYGNNGYGGTGSSSNGYGAGASSGSGDGYSATRGIDLGGWTIV